MSLKFSLLLSTAAVVVIGAPVLAQSTTTSPPTQQVETIVVTGSRPIQESDRAALNVQRNSIALVSVLSADEAGRLADQDRKSTRLNSSHRNTSRMPSSA